MKAILYLLQAAIILAASACDSRSRPGKEAVSGNSPPASTELVQGPFGALDGAASGGAVSEWIHRPDRPLGPKGSLMVWFRLDSALRPGPEAQVLDEVLLEAPGIFTVSLENDTRQTTLRWDWDGVSGRSDQNLSLALPGLPGPGWIHLAARWDAAEGIFDVFLNGTPARLPGTVLEPWQTGRADHIIFPIARIAISSPLVSAELFSSSDLRHTVSTLYLGSLDALLGSRAPERLADNLSREKAVMDLALASSADVTNWVMEGSGEATFADGWMRLKSNGPAGDGHFVFWSPEDLPDSFLAEWEFQLVEPDGLCIVFFSARGRDGEDIFDPKLQSRDGVFRRYHSGDIDAYHISYFANNPGNEPGRATVNLRKNHGFYLVENGPSAIPAASREVHRMQLIKVGGWIRLAADGLTVIDFRDDGNRYGHPLGAGKMGFRQMRSTDARYRNLRVYEIKVE